MSLRSTSVSITLFLLIALLPLSLLFVISIYYNLEIHEQLSNIFFGALLIQVDLNEGNFVLERINSLTLQHIMNNNTNDKDSIESQIKSYEANFTSLLNNYRNIQSFPMQVDILNRRGQGDLIETENRLTADLRNRWTEFTVALDSTLQFSKDNKTVESLRNHGTDERQKFDNLLTDYKKTIDINTVIAQIMYEESLVVAQQALVYDLSLSVVSVLSIIVSLILLKKVLNRRKAERGLD